MAVPFTKKSEKKPFSLSFIFNHLSRLKMVAYLCASRAPRFFERPQGRKEGRLGDPKAHAAAMEKDSGSAMVLLTLA
jgi:hypothetical protein